MLNLGLLIAPPRVGVYARGCRVRHHSHARSNGLIDFELTDEQRLIRETAREFTDREIVPVARDNDRNERFDTELVKKLGDMGYLGPIVAEEYGGRGLDYRSYALIVEEVGRGDSSARTVVSVQTSLVCSSIQRWGSEEQKHEWLPRLCSGEILGCFGLTEPDTGSDAANLKTRGEKTDGGGRISARSSGSRWATTQRSRSSSPRPIPSRSTAGSPRSSFPPSRPASRRRRSTASSGCAPRTRRSCRLTAWRLATRRCSATSATASRSRCRRSTRAATAWPRAAWGSARAASTHRWSTRRTASSSAARSRASSSFSRCSPTWSWTPRLRARSSGAPA